MTLNGPDSTGISQIIDYAMEQSPHAAQLLQAFKPVITRQRQLADMAILAPADYTAWLSADTALDQVQRLIQPCPEGLLAAHPVSTGVGNVRNEGSELIRAV